jgi:Protein of unknown function (DUF4242)
MKKFVVERILPGAENLTPEELITLAKTFCEVIEKMRKPYHWIQSFITTDKIYCIHIAETAEVIREHAKLGKLPINTIAEVKIVIDPSTNNPS